LKSSPGRHRYTSPATDIPEASDLEWTDEFYSTDQDQEIVAVFDIHYDRLIARLRQAKFVALGASIVTLLVAFFYLSVPKMTGSSQELTGNQQTALFMAAGLAAVFGGMWWMESKEERRIRGRHVAVTRQGIRRDSSGRDDVQTSTLLPFDHIRSIELQRGILRTTHSLGSIQIRLQSRLSKPIEVEGLVNAPEFITLVLAMMKTVEPSAGLEEGDEDDGTATDARAKKSEV
jgi:hypothetical protein